MKAKKLLSPSKTRLQVQSQQASWGHQAGDAGETIPNVPCGLQGEENRRINTFHDDIQSTPTLRSHDSPPYCSIVVENHQSLAAMLEAALGSWGYEVWAARNG